MGFRFNFLVIAFLLIVSCGFSQSVTVFGVDSVYSGTELEFKAYSNGITNNESLLGTVVCDSLGSFKCQFNISETSEVFFRAGKFEVYFVATPDKEYNLLLPPLAKLSEQDKMNPFFVYNRVFARFVNTEDYDLNSAINKFDYRYFQVYSNCSFVNVASKSKLIIKSKIDSLSLEFDSVDNKYFSLYKDSRLALLEYKFKIDDYMANAEFVLGKYPKGVMNRAYSELLNVYIDDILNFSKNKLNDKIRFLFWKKQSLGVLLSEIKKSIDKDFLAELFVIKAVDFYSVYDELDFGYLMQLLIDVDSQSGFEINKKISQQAHKKLTHLHKGYPSPDLILKDRAGKVVDIKSYKGKYVLIGFCTTQGISVYNELKNLRNFYGKFTRNLKVVLVFKSEEKDFVSVWDDTIHERWDVLFIDEEKSVLQDFNVKVLPTFYLMGRDGNMVLSPALYMSEGFEGSMRDILLKESRRR